MFAKGIKISWWYPTEYINIDLDNLSSETSITSSYELWPKENEVLSYNTVSAIHQRSDGVFVLTITYDSNNNPHLKNKAVCWGVSTIEIMPGADSGTATWEDFYNPDHNGTVTWTRSGNGLRKPKKRVRTTKLEREQTQFRAALLSMDNCCAITGEDTERALDAAHIIPSAEGGAEVVENGILLRADLHRLYDDHLFVIQPDGWVKVTGDLSNDYRTLLHGKRLTQTVLSRVQQALEISGRPV